MTMTEDAALRLASTLLRAKPEASIDEIAEVISQFGGLTSPGELDRDSAFDDSANESDDSDESPE
jgi:hypothetical protein